MNRTETIKILAMLSAYYGQGKSDPEQMVSAWHVILKDYEYGVAEKAVIEFARTDQRDYATFPSVGQVIKAIESQKGYVNEIYNALYFGKSYDGLSEGAKRLITKKNYEEGLKKTPEELTEKEGQIKDALRGKQSLPMLEG